jgi:hypothetical protein
MHHVVETALAVMKQSQVPMEAQKAAMELLLAEALAYHQPLPAESVAQPELYFLAQCKVTVLAQLAKANEHFVISMDSAADLTYSIWLVRYSLVHRLGWAGAGQLLHTALQNQYSKIGEAYSGLLSQFPTLGFAQHTLEENAQAELRGEYGNEY